MLRQILTIFTLGFGMTTAALADTLIEPDEALELLEHHNQHFTQRVVKVSDSVYTAIGFHGANTSMIVGDDGLIIVDTLMGPESAGNAFRALREYSDKPVVAIIYTHSHDDHTGGASAFVGDSSPAVYARTNFGPGLGVSKDLRPILIKRGIRQFGRKLKPEDATNRGVAAAVTIDHDRGKGYLEPTIHVSDDGLKTTIAGVELEFQVGPGETDDAMFVWMPSERVLFSGDNFYQAFPNLYAIRGTAYRNVMNWSDSVAAMALFNPEHLVPGHTSPISGEAQTSQALRDYSNAIRSVYEQTIAGINAGKGPDQLAHEVTLPENLEDKPYLIQFYGSVPHAMRAIYAGLLGWFDGDPVNLNRSSPLQEAQRMAGLAGGNNALMGQMEVALAGNDYQWALELAGHLKWLEVDQARVKTVTISALRALAAREYNAPNRNYYLSFASELEAR